MSGVPIARVRMLSRFAPLGLSLKRVAVKLHPVILDLAVTATASIFTFAASIGTVALFARLHGSTALAEYLLLRRIMASLLPVAHLGLGVALPRYVAYSHDKQREEQIQYFVAALGCVLVSSALIGGVLFAFPAFTSALLFGDVRYRNLTLPLCFLIAGGAIQACVYGLYRGRLQMHRAGLLQAGVAAIPIAVLLVLRTNGSVPQIASAIGCSVLALSIIVAIEVFANLRRAEVMNSPARAIKLLKYGLSRVPGDISIGALFAVGPAMALHFLPMSRVSALLIATGVVMATTVSTDALGLVFLSKISMMLGSGRVDTVRTHLGYLVSAVADLSLFATIQLIVFADVLLRLWIGPIAVTGALVARLLLCGVPSYLFFTALRSAVDAHTVRPVNARNIVQSLIALVALLSVSAAIFPREQLLNAFAISIALALVMLGHLTHRALVREYQLRVRWRESVLPCGGALLLGGAGLVYHRFTYVSLLALCSLEVLFAGTFLLICYSSGSRWIRVLFSLIFQLPGSSSPEEPGQTATSRGSAA